MLFPAHAGMIPLRKAITATVVRVPRPRGDDPYRDDLFFDGFECPRPRGDDPVPPILRAHSTGCSPPTRG